jgi:hypothetical protein
VQTALLDAPVALLNEPAGQDVASTKDKTGQNAPIGQGVGLVKPGNGQCDPIGHGRQVEFEDAPSEPLYEPAGQAVGLSDAMGQK